MIGVTKDDVERFFGKYGVGEKLGEQLTPEAWAALTVGFVNGGEGVLVGERGTEKTFLLWCALAFELNRVLRLGPVGIGFAVGTLLDVVVDLSKRPSYGVVKSIASFVFDFLQDVRGLKVEGLGGRGIISLRGEPASVQLRFHGPTNHDWEVYGLNVVAAFSDGSMMEHLRERWASRGKQGLCWATQETAGPLRWRPVFRNPMPAVNKPCPEMPSLMPQAEAFHEGKEVIS